MGKKPLFFRYLKDRRILLFLFAAWIGLFFLIALLSQVTVWPVAYSALLSAALGTVFLLLDFHAYRQKHKNLCQLIRHVTAYFAEDIRAENLIEEEYQQLAIALQQARQETERVFQERWREEEEYYTVWAHQIKTPIAAMRLLLQEQPAFGKPFLQELFRVEQYVDMVLQYLRLGAGTGDLVLCPCCLDSVVRQAVKKTASLFIYKKLSLELGDLKQTVISDEKWLVFVLEQLLTNAVKYTSQGKISIYLLLEAPLTLVVEDTGIGISPEDLPRIFEWGFTGKNGRVDQYSTGIGLYLCRKAMRLLGHQMEIQSQIGKGTKVFLKMAQEKLLIE